MIEELKAIIGPNEKILYEGKPNKKCYMFEGIFNPLLPFALLWLIVDLGFIGLSVSQEGGKLLYFLVPFFLIHLMPVWIYLAGALFILRKYRRTAYIVTDRAIYVSGGTFTTNIQHKPFAELSHIDLHRGIFDQMFNVGDIIATSNQIGQNGRSATIVINSISDYTDIYNLINKLQTDIYTDVMYPNDLRPKENHGYNTEYKG